MSNMGVYIVTNCVNKKKYVAISHDIDNEWFKMKRDLKSGLGPKKMKDDYKEHGENNFTFEIVLRTSQFHELHRKESEIAYDLDVWSKGYNDNLLLNYRLMTEERLAELKLKFYRFIEKIDDGKYMIIDLLTILDLSKNDLEILLNEITEEEMQYFKKRVTLKNKNMGLLNYYMQVKSF